MASRQQHIADNPSEPKSDLPRQNEEAAIMRRAQQDPAWFAPLYERYVSRIYAYCRRRTSTEQEAEDLCSQVFAKVLGALHTYQGGMVAAWLFRIAHNVVVDHYRKRHTLVALDNVAPEHVMMADDFTELVELNDQHERLNTLIAALPPDKRRLLLLCLDSERTSQDVGDLLGKSAGAVRVEFHRIVKSLRDQYAQHMGEDSQ